LVDFSPSTIKRNHRNVVEIFRQLISSNSGAASHFHLSDLLDQNHKYDWMQNPPNNNGIFDEIPENYEGIINADVLSGTFDELGDKIPTYADIKIEQNL
jgi:hypothetical protein